MHTWHEQGHDRGGGECECEQQTRGLQEPDAPGHPGPHKHGGQRQGLSRRGPLPQTFFECPGPRHRVAASNLLTHNVLAPCAQRMLAFQLRPHPPGFLLEPCLQGSKRKHMDWVSHL